MHHNGPGGRWVRDFHPADEGEQSGGVVRNSVIGPASEVELLDLPHLVETTLRGEKDSRLHSIACHLSVNSTDDSWLSSNSRKFLQLLKILVYNHTTFQTKAQHNGPAHPLQCKCADDIFSQGLHLHKSHFEVSVHLCVIWPVLVALHLFGK